MKISCNLRFLIGASVALLTCALANPSARAQATRTWVSGTGDDANPCSRTAPCKTYAGTISKTAPGGEIDAIDPGGFGAVTITKAITIDGQGPLASILASGAYGVTINAAATDVVTLRNISINGANGGLTGIRILNAAVVNIENCTITGFTGAPGYGIDIKPGVACRVNIKNTIVRNCTGGAVYAEPGATGAVVTISNSSLCDCPYGLYALSYATCAVDDCVISGHTICGVGVGASAAAVGAVTVNRCQITDNANGVVAQGANSVARISDNSITGNTTGISAKASAQVISFGNNNISGNTTDGTPSSTVATK